ncbi:heterokaryon incompatibility protein [Colletotrichum truncatum]|uniref:Heterokaryon incompatibility protein n=1 Tax=Colletotrichum truncatum TaxID=5467 RepID=A0ACC3YN09_COLTU|nr:heterokaryon incompatibility protein [Colletotrichum truncatum]KAF6789625.1 heterokaryon incompatibility protein [Colletotrichum truncatum]
MAYQSPENPANHSYKRIESQSLPKSLSEEERVIVQNGEPQPNLSFDGKSTTTGLEYNRLPDSSSYIRLLKFKEAGDSSPSIVSTSCFLQIFALSKAPPYIAISYTWGPSTPLKNIEVDGYQVPVRANCEAVLQQCYQYDSTAFYWIDAICIDQENLEEKGPQVSMMGRLYGGADHVMACTGDHEDDSELLYATLEKNAELFWEFGGFRRSHFVDEASPQTFNLWAIRKGMRFLVRLCAALNAFLKREYFQRVWIYQELALGEQVILCCGKSFLPINLFHGLSMGITTWRSPSKPWKERWILKMVGLTERMNAIGGYPKEHPFLIAGSFVKEPFLLKTLIDETTSLSCQDLRDRVYAILSLVDWKGPTPLQPDYNKDSFDLAAEFLSAAWKQEDFSSFTYIITIVKNLGLHHCPSAKTTEVMQRRNTVNALSETESPKEIETALRRGRPIEERIYVECAGSRIEYDEKEDLLFVKARNYNKTCMFEPGDEFYQSSTLAAPLDSSTFHDSIVLPRGAQVGDWIMSGPISDGLTVVVRQQADGPYFSIVGTGYRNTNEIMWWRTRFRLYLDPEDAIVVANLVLPFKSRGTLADLRVLMRTRFCGSPGSSFAQRWNWKSDMRYC